LFFEKKSIFSKSMVNRSLAEDGMQLGFHQMSSFLSIQPRLAISMAKREGIWQRDFVCTLCNADDGGRNVESLYAGLDHRSPSSVRGR